MLGAVTALVNSEKAVAGGLLIIGATVLVITGHATIEQWLDYTKWIFTAYVAGKTAQGAMSVWGAATTAKAQAPSVMSSVTIKAEERGGDAP